MPGPAGCGRATAFGSDGRDMFGRWGPPRLGRWKLGVWGRAMPPGRPPPGMGRCTFGMLGLAVGMGLGAGICGRAAPAGRPAGMGRAIAGRAPPPPPARPTDGRASAVTATHNEAMTIHAETPRGSMGDLPLHQHPERDGRSTEIGPEMFSSLGRGCRHGAGWRRRLAGDDEFEVGLLDTRDHTVRAFDHEVIGVGRLDDDGRRTGGAIGERRL